MFRSIGRKKKLKYLVIALVICTFIWKMLLETEVNKTVSWNEKFILTNQLFIQQGSYKSEFLEKESNEKTKRLKSLLLIDQIDDKKKSKKPKPPEVQRRTLKFILKEMNTTSSSTFYKGLFADWWYDICIKRTSSEQLWHPLFPNFPQQITTIFMTADTDRYIGMFYRRIYGYIFPNTSGIYDFKLSSRDGAEVLLLDTNTNLPYPDNGQRYREVFHLKLSKDLMDYQDKRIKLTEMFSTQKYGVFLKKDRLYYVEIFQAGKYFAKYQLQWRLKKSTVGYQTIGPENILFTNDTRKIPSQIMKKRIYNEKYPVNEAEQRRLSFNKIPTLPVWDKINNSSMVCSLERSGNVTIKYLYQGYRELLERIAVYPKELFNLKKGKEKESDIYIKEDEAVLIAQKTFEKLNTVYNNTLELDYIVHLTTNVNNTPGKQDRGKKYYFVELDVKYVGHEKIFRSSNFMRLSRDDDVCFLEDFDWKENVKITLMTPIRNQVIWLKYLIHMLESLISKTSENNVNLILIDNNSTDGNYEEILKASNLKHTYLNMASRSFNKVKALNYGLKHIKDDNTIAFVLDLHLQLPLNIFDRIRKLTIQGKTAFAPTLMKLACGEHEQYTELEKSVWLDFGTGMIALYKSDWTKVGGFNEKLFNKKWGGEDWEVIDRIYKNGLFVIHGRMPRFYHVHHSRDKMWDKS